MRNRTGKVTSYTFAIVLWFVLSALSGAVSAGVNDQGAEDQMVCYVYEIRRAMDSSHREKNVFKCIKRSSRNTHDYSNLAEIYSEGWSVVSINNDNIWLLTKRY